MDARRLTVGHPAAGRHLAAALLLLTAVLAACSGSSPAAGPSATPTAGPGSELPLRVTSGYGRHAAVRAKADLRLVNEGNAEISLVTLQVRHPLFERQPPVERRTVLPPDGDVRLVPVPLGAPLCDRDDATGASLAVGVQTPDGVQAAVLPLADREPGLVRAHRLACAIAAVEDLVTVELATDGLRIPTPEGEGVVLDLEVRRNGGGDPAVTVTELLGSILFSLAGTPPPQLVQLAPDARSAGARVVLLASRCDRHAMIESKTSFTFPLFASVDGGPPVRLSTTATGTARNALQALLDDTCGSGQP